jgi:hypothetical protein
LAQGGKFKVFLGGMPFAQLKMWLLFKDNKDKDHVFTLLDAFIARTKPRGFI